MKTKIKLRISELTKAEQLSTEQMKNLFGGACATGSCSVGGQSGNCVTGSGGLCWCKVAGGYGGSASCW